MSMRWSIVSSSSFELFFLGQEGKRYGARTAGAIVSCGRLMNCPRPRREWFDSPLVVCVGYQRFIVATISSSTIFQTKNFREKSLPVLLMTYGWDFSIMKDIEVGWTRGLHETMTLWATTLLNILPLFFSFFTYRMFHYRTAIASPRQLSKLECPWNSSLVLIKNATAIRTCFYLMLWRDTQSQCGLALCVPPIARAWDTYHTTSVLRRSGFVTPCSRNDILRKFQSLHAVIQYHHCRKSLSAIDLRIISEAKCFQRWTRRTYFCRS